MKKLFYITLIVLAACSCGKGNYDNVPGGNGNEQVFTGTASNITATSATIMGNFSSTTAASSIQLGILYSTEKSTIDNKQGTLVLANSISGSSYTVEIVSLLSNTVYYYRAYMVSGGNTYYGSVNSFTSSQDELVTTGDATDITYKSATISSRFKTNSLLNFSALGIEYSDSEEIVNNGRGSVVKTTDVTNNNVFTVSLTNLTELTTYYYRAYVKTYETTYFGITKSFTTSEHSVDYNGHAFVDLGLPSGTKWATMNVGASKPEDIGDYYAWGETTTKTYYTKDNYQWQGLSLDELVSRGVIYEERITNTYSKYYLTETHDVATLKWGSAWHMPSASDIMELEKYTIINAKTQNGVNGFLLTSTINKNNIFIPAGGYMDETGLVNGNSASSNPWYRATCWASEPNEYSNDYSIGLWIDNGSSSGMRNISYSGSDRYCGSPIRPVSSY